MGEFSVDEIRKALQSTVSNAVAPLLDKCLQLVIFCEQILYDILDGRIASHRDFQT